MPAVPEEINVLISRNDIDRLHTERWGAFDLFRQLMLNDDDALANGKGMRLARPFYEKFVLHLLLFDDVFRDFETTTSANEIGQHILHQIKAALAGQPYTKLIDRSDEIGSSIMIKKSLIQRLISRRVERDSLESVIKSKFMLKQMTDEGHSYRFELKGKQEMRMMREAIAYTAMVEALQTSPKKISREAGHRLAAENTIRILMVHNIFDSRIGFRVPGNVLDVVRSILNALDRDGNGLLSLTQATDTSTPDISPQKNRQLWDKLRSYDINNDGYLTADEQVKLKEAIADLILRGRLSSQETEYTFEKVESILARELPLCRHN